MAVQRKPASQPRTLTDGPKASTVLCAIRSSITFSRSVATSGYCAPADKVPFFPNATNHCMFGTVASRWVHPKSVPVHFYAFETAFPFLAGLRPVRGVRAGANGNDSRRIAHSIRHRQLPRERAIGGGFLPMASADLGTRHSVLSKPGYILGRDRTGRRKVHLGEPRRPNGLSQGTQNPKRRAVARQCGMEQGGWARSPAREQPCRLVAPSGNS